MQYGYHPGIATLESVLQPRYDLRNFDRAVINVILCTLTTVVTIRGHGSSRGALQAFTDASRAWFHCDVIVKYPDEQCRMVSLVLKPVSQFSQLSWCFTERWGYEEKKGSMFIYLIILSLHIHEQLNMSPHISWYMNMHWILIVMWISMMALVT